MYMTNGQKINDLKLCRNAEYWKIRVGTNKKSNSGNANGQQVGVRKIVVHEEYNPRDIDYDVSVFILSSPLKLDGIKINPIGLPAQNQDIPDGSLAVTSGWGNLNVSFTFL